MNGLGYNCFPTGMNLLANEQQGDCGARATLGKETLTEKYRSILKSVTRFLLNLRDRLAFTFRIFLIKQSPTNASSTRT